MRSLATRQSNLALSKYMDDVISIFKASDFDLIILETSGIGQSDTEITDYCNVALYAMTPEYGAASQLEKIDMLDYADIVAINKYDKKGAEDALRDVKKQYKRNHNLWEASDDSLPIYGTIASQFNDPGINRLYSALLKKITEKTGKPFNSGLNGEMNESEKIYIIPPSKIRYLSEITQTIREYNQQAKSQSDLADMLYSLQNSLRKIEDKQVQTVISDQIKKVKKQLLPENQEILDHWDEEVEKYSNEEFVFNVRGKDIVIKTVTESLSHNKIPKVSLPKFRSWGDILEWKLQENVPGKFPYAAGIYPFKREGEDPTRMFAGEGNPERTNKRFHYVSAEMEAKRLSTAFDSVTLYGRDPDYRPDIYGKIGNSGVSICCLDDLKKLYSGFNLSDPKTSVSMTINGPAPMLLAYFMNAAIDQQCEIYIKEKGLEKEILEKIEKIYKKKGQNKPSYNGPLPKGNNGLGLFLL